MGISAARENLSEAVETARTEAVILERFGRPAAVLVSPEKSVDNTNSLLRWVAEAVVTCGSRGSGAGL